MSRDIRPLQPNDLPALSQFLTRGFGTAADAEFAAPDVLRWKYFDPRGDRDVPRSLVAWNGSEIIGHVGMWHAWLQNASQPAHRISTVHGIDWLASPSHRSTGVRLMRRGNPYADTHYALNYNDNARRVVEAAGYKLVQSVPVYVRVLRPGYRLRAAGNPLTSRLRAARDLARSIVHRPRAPVLPIELQAVDSFGPDVLPVFDGCRVNAWCTSRQPEWLNHALRYPRSRLVGYHVRHEGRLRGVAIVNAVHRPEVRLGRIVECFLDDPEPRLWHAAVSALIGALEEEAVDLVETFGSTPWMQQALEQSGFVSPHRANFLLHDPQGLVPTGVPFHLTPFEADYAYS